MAWYMNNDCTSSADVSAIYAAIYFWLTLFTTISNWILHGTSGFVETGLYDKIWIKRQSLWRWKAWLRLCQRIAYFYMGLVFWQTAKFFSEIWIKEISWQFWVLTLLVHGSIRCLYMKPTVIIVATAKRAPYMYKMR